MTPASIYVARLTYSKYAAFVCTGTELTASSFDLAYRLRPSIGQGTRREDRGNERDADEYQSHQGMYQCYRENQLFTHADCDRSQLNAWEGEMHRDLTVYGPLGDSLRLFFESPQSIIFDGSHYFGTRKYGYSDGVLRSVPHSISLQNFLPLLPCLSCLCLLQSLKASAYGHPRHSLRRQSLLKSEVSASNLQDIRSSLMPCMPIRKLYQASQNAPKLSRGKSLSRTSLSVFKLG